MRHQVNDLFIKIRIKLELLDMLVIMETLKAVPKFEGDFPKLIESTIRP